MTETTALGWRQWRRMWLAQGVKWLVFLPLLALWMISTPLKAFTEWSIDQVNAARVRAYNADRRCAFGRQPRRPGALRPDGEL